MSAFHSFSFQNIRNPLWYAVLTVLMVGLFSTAWINVGLADFYVSPRGSDSNPGTLAAPFQTIDHARLAVRNVSGGMASDINVYLRGGTYKLNNTLTFDSGDSGKNGHNIIYRNYTGETPVISGGRRITGWSNIGGGVWRAPSGGLRFRQLYINDQRAIRARTPNAGSYNNVVLWVGKNWTADGLDRHIDVNASEISSWGNLNKVEMVVSKEWIQNNLRIASFSIQGSVAHIKLMDPDVQRAFGSSCAVREPSDQGCNHGKTYGVHAPYYFENAREFLDQPGEFYLDESASLLYYMPRSGEEMSSAVVMAPVLERIVGIVGSYGNPVRNLQLYGITFEHSTWMEPSNSGFSNRGGDVMNPPGGGTTTTPGGIHVEFADGVRLERNTLRNMGGAGLATSQGSHNISVIGNVIKSISAAGIHSADLDMTTANNGDTNVVESGIVIQNNFINQVGRDYHSSPGIVSQFVSSLSIEHNEVSDGGYIGIGFETYWTDGGTGPLVINIRNNHVHNVMNMMADGGGIYTFFAKRPGTKITGNFSHDIYKSNFAGGSPVATVYEDNCTDYVDLSNNVLRNAPELIHLNYDPPACSLHNSTGYNPSSDATIEANAGIEAAYRDIINLAPAPAPTSLPDVIVTAVSYAIGNFTATIKNQGSAATPAGVYIGIGYFVDSVYRTSTWVLGPLAAGASVAMTGGNSYIIPAGTHTIMGYADDVNRFAEANETNNQLSKSITVP